jgi:hypothetical protein
LESDRRRSKCDPSLGGKTRRYRIAILTASSPQSADIPVFAS